jgi:hypothetical protein
MGRLSVTIEMAHSVPSMSILIETEMYSLESRSSFRDPNSGFFWNMSSCPSSLTSQHLSFHGCASAGSWQMHSMVTNKGNL